MITPQTKLYVQLEPTPITTECIVQLQNELRTLDNSLNRLVARSQLHVTILHIGLVERFITSIQVQRPALQTQELLPKIARLVTDLETIVQSDSATMWRLSPNGYALFGAIKNTLVITFQANSRLEALHATCLVSLEQFLRSCGIQDQQAFMQQDENLQYALTLRPHIALAKSCTCVPPPTALPTMNFTLMPIVY